MMNHVDIEELKRRGAGKPASVEMRQLYSQAFRNYGARALWNWSKLEEPTITQVLAIANSLRVEGDTAARMLAVRIENACRAAL